MFGKSIFIYRRSVSRLSFSFWLAPRAQEQTLRAVYNALGGVMAPIWLAQDAGLFTKHGVNVDLKYLAATSAVQAMVGGGEEVGLVGNQGIDAKLEGADLIYVASGLPTFVFQMYARPEIKTLGGPQGQGGRRRHSRLPRPTTPAASSCEKRLGARQGRENHVRSRHQQRVELLERRQCCGRHLSRLLSIKAKAAG